MNALRPVALILAPSVGGLVGAYCGWKVLFYILGGWGCCAFLLYALTFDETCSPISGSKAPVCSVLCNRVFIGMNGFSVFRMAAIMCMLSNISFVLPQYYEMSKPLTGVLIGVIPVTALIASFMVMSISNNVSCFRIVERTAILTVPVCAFIIIVGLYLYPDGVWIFIISCCSYVFIIFIADPAATVILLQPFKELAGLVTGLNMVLWKSLGAAISVISTYLYDGTPRFMLFSMVACGLLSALWYGIVIGRIGISYSLSSKSEALLRASDPDEALLRVTIADEDLIRNTVFDPVEPLIRITTSDLNYPDAGSNGSEDKG